MANDEKELYKQVQRRLVASLVYDSEDAHRVFEIVRPDDIDEPTLEIIFNSIMELSRKDEKISIISIAKELEAKGELEKAGGIQELYILKNEGEKYRLENPIDVFALVTRESSAKNKIANILDDSKKDFKDNSGISAVDGISNLQSLLNEKLYTLSDESTMSDISSAIDSYDDLLREREKISKENEEKAEGLQGIPSLFPTLNKYTHGWSPQQLITIGARTGVGKSIFAIDAAVAAGQAGKSVLFFSLEMSTPEINDRIIACISGVSQSKLKNGIISEDERKSVKQALGEIEHMKISIDTDPKVTVDSIRAKSLRKAQSPDGLDMIIIDYLQLITPVGRFNSRQEQVADISRNVKLLAKNLNVPIMVLVQLNRAKDDEDEKLPTVDNIRESAAIAHDSDVVILLHRDVALDDTTPQTLLILAKNRNGENNKIIRCHSNLACSLFREIKREKDTTDRLTESDLQDLEDDIDMEYFEDFDDDISVDDL